MIRYKVDILQALKKRGYNTNKIREEKILGQATLQKIRHNELVSWNNINTICKILGCNIGDILEYTEDEIANINPGDTIYKNDDISIH